MSCCFMKSNKRADKNIRRYRRNAIYPHNKELDVKSKDIPTKEYVEVLNKECIVCHHCKKMCRLRNDEINILCSGCGKFFHCHIAGKCRGKECTHTTSNSIHQLSYCLNCVNHITIQDDTCLCNSCVSVESL